MSSEDKKSLNWKFIVTVVSAILGFVGLGSIFVFFKQVEKVAGDYPLPFVICVAAALFVGLALGLFLGGRAPRKGIDALPPEVDKQPIETPTADED